MEGWRKDKNDFIVEEPLRKGLVGRIKRNVGIGGREEKKIWKQL